MIEIYNIHVHMYCNYEKQVFIYLYLKVFCIMIEILLNQKIFVFQTKPYYVKKSVNM